jgi:hypothetical protein
MLKHGGTSPNSTNSLTTEDWVRRGSTVFGVQPQNAAMSVGRSLTSQDMILPRDFVLVLVDDPFHATHPSVAGSKVIVLRENQNDDEFLPARRRSGEISGYVARSSSPIPSKKRF